MFQLELFKVKEGMFIVARLVIDGSVVTAILTLPVGCELKVTRKFAPVPSFIVIVVGVTSISGESFSIISTVRTCDKLLNPSSSIG